MWLVVIFDFFPFSKTFISLKRFHQNYSINYWISHGAPRSKIVLGLGSYGRSFTLSRANANGLGAPAPQKGQAGPYTREGGSLGYNEVFSKIDPKSLVF